MTNREVIVVDQDSLGMQGRRVKRDGDREVWAKQLADGGRAVVLFNRRAQEPGDLRVVDRNRVSAARGGSGAGSVGTQGSREAHRKVFRGSTEPRRSDGKHQALD